MKTKDLFKGIIKPWFKYVIYGLLLLSFLLVVNRSCNLTDGYSKRIGELEALVRIQEDAEEMARDNIDAALDRIDTLTGENKKLMKHIEVAELELVDTDRDVSRLEKELIDAQDTGDTDVQIANLTDQVNLWKERFTLSQSIVADKDEIIFNLNEKYESQLEISVDFEKLYLAEKDLRHKGEVLLDMSSRKLRTAKTGGTFKTIVICMLGGYVAYKITQQMGDKT